MERTTRRKILKRALLGLAGMGIAYSGTRYLMRSANARKGVVLIVVDAMRGDRVGRQVSYDSVKTSLTPTLDALAQQGISFSKAVSTSSWTPVSMGATLFNTDPQNVRYGDKGLEVHGRSQYGRSIVDTTQANEGVFSMAVCANEVLDQRVITDRFDRFACLRKDDTRPTYRPRFPEISSSAVNKVVKDNLDELAAEKSFFLYVHYMDTHAPYFCVPEDLYRMGSGLNSDVSLYNTKAALAEGSPLVKTPFPFGRDTPLEQALQHLESRYNASVINVDRSIRDLLATLDEKGFLDDALVIVTADHGEEFGDNCETRRTCGHASNLSQQQIHVPLMVWHKKASSGVSINNPVSNAEIVTRFVNDFSAGAAPEETLLTLHTGVTRPAYLNWRDGAFYASITGTEKVLVNLDDPQKPLLFSLSDFTRPTAVATTAEDSDKIMSKINENLGRVPAGNVNLEFDEETMRQLRALGYLN